MPAGTVTLTANFEAAGGGGDGEDILPPSIVSVTATPTQSGAVLEVEASDASALTYQWQVKGSWIDIPGATSARYDYSGLEAGKSYTVRVIVTDAAGNTTVSPEISFTVGAAPITGLPESYTLIKGKNVHFTPSPSGGTWTYDSDYLSLSESGGKATFTAKRVGKTYVKYAVGGNEHIVTITINASTIPQTGDASGNMLPYVLAGALALMGMSAGVFIRRRKKHA